MRQRERIILSFLLLAVGSTALFGWMSSNGIHQGFRQYVAAEQENRLSQWATVLGNYYAQQGSWNHVQDLLSVRGGGRGMGTGMGKGMGNGRGGPMNGSGFQGNLILADTEGRSIVPSSDENIINLPSPETILKNGRPIETNGITVGYLLAQPAESSLQTLESRFSDSITRSVLWSGSAAVALALSLGIYLSLRLTRPLEHLTRATEKMTEGSGAFKVVVTSDDEIGKLGASFNRMIEALEHNEKIRRTLVADVAHELRTPLSILRGNLESMLAGVVEPTEEILAQLHDEVIRMSDLIRDLQQISLAEAGKLQLHREKLSMEEWVYNWAAPFRPDIEAKNMDLDISVEPNLPFVHLDPQKFGQVMANLLSNALRYSREKGRIGIDVRIQKEDLTLAVSDNGIGIAKEDLPYIFERFYRGDAGRARAEGGTGLGLAIAKGLVELHGGTINAESELNVGTTFLIIVPISSFSNREKNYPVF